jgi:hypothetical protein
MVVVIVFALLVISNKLKEISAGVRNVEMDA